MERCNVKRCRQEGSLWYYGHHVCARCWDRHCDKDDRFDLKSEFKIDR